MQELMWVRLYSDGLRAGRLGFDSWLAQDIFSAPQAGSGAHPASYKIGARGSFPGRKAAEA
jgi:hypothetical protein